MANSLSDPRYRQIIERLRQARIDAGFSQSEIAKRLGKPQSFVAKVEACERRLDVLEFVELSEAIGLYPSNILGN